MKILKLLTPLFISSLITIPSYATEIESVYQWGSSSIFGGFGAGIEYRNTYDSKSMSFDATISHSGIGSQRLYFTNYHNNDLNVCSYKSSSPDSTTIVVNGQAVKMLRWCKKFSNTNKYYYEYTPETDRGDSHIVNLFKVATSPIEIQYNNETLYFPVVGFTKAWNSAGGNAI